jgi:hypothetical protein
LEVKSPLWRFMFDLAGYAALLAAGDLKKQPGCAFLE